MRYYLPSFFLTFLLDLTTKTLAENYLKESVKVLPFLNLTLIYNKGVAFGLLSDLPDLLRLPLLILIPIVAIIFTLYYSKGKGKVEGILLGLIGGGALGNLYDRITLGKVRDFIDFHIFNWHYPAFNLADASISVSILLLIFMELFKSRRFVL